jgi:hypothetical protein
MLGSGKPAWRTDKRHPIRLLSIEDALDMALVEAGAPQAAGIHPQRASFTSRCT